jgi:RimJ/RimL family protein N-acetyltransferase
MIDFLAGRGTERVVGHVLRDNRAMRELALKAGFVVDKDASEGDALRFVRSLLAPPQPSVRR